MPNAVKAPEQMTVVELDRHKVEEMLRAYLVAKFAVPVTPLHRVSMTMFPDKMVVRVHAIPGMKLADPS